MGYLDNKGLERFKSNLKSKFATSLRIQDGTLQLISGSGAVLCSVTLPSGVLNPFPVGAIYISVVGTDPSELFGGTWERIQDTFLLAAGSTYAAGATGGEATHKLTHNEMPSHSHTLKFVGNTAEIWSLSTKFQNGDKSQIISYGTGKAGVDITSTGGSQAHNNMPPYLAVYIWKRTA